MSMTICIFSALYEPHVGGVERFTQALAEELCARGNRVLIVTSNHAGLPAVSFPQDGLTVYRFPCYSFLGSRLPVPKRNVEYRQLASRLADEGIDQVCVNTRFYPHSQFGVEFARQKGLTPLVIEHGSDYLTLGNPLVDSVIRFYERRVTKKLKKANPLFYAVSKRGSAWLRTFGIESRGEINNAIEIDSFLKKSSQREYRQELSVSDDATLVAYVGRLEPEKGVEQLMAAAGQLSYRRDIHFLIAGEGSMRERLHAVAPDNVHFLGAVSQPDVVALLQSSDIFCLPSRSEGFATVLLEAAACFAAPIVTDVGGVDELIPDDRYGVVLADREPETIAQAILELCEDHKRMREIVSNIHEHVRLEYNWSKTAEKLLGAFAASGK